MEKATHIVLPVNLVNQLVNYLQTHPYKQVAGYLAAIEKTGRATVLDKEEESDGESQAS